MSTTVSIEDRLSALEKQLTKATLGPINPDTLYTVEDVANRLACGLSNVYSLIKNEQIAVIRVGNGSGGKRIRGCDLLAFLDSRREGGPKPEGTFKHLKELNNA